MLLLLVWEHFHWSDDFEDKGARHDNPPPSKVSYDQLVPTQELALVLAETPVDTNIYISYINYRYILEVNKYLLTMTYIVHWSIILTMRWQWVWLFHVRRQSPRKATSSSHHDFIFRHSRWNISMRAIVPS